MHCHECGKKIDEDSKFCEFCGTPLKSSKIVTEDKKEKVDMPKIGKWSWGGAAITFWYALYMNFGWGWALLLLFIMGAIRALQSNSETVWLGLILYITMFLYIGFNARKWAWQKRKWVCLDQFLDTQRAWDVWGIIVFILTIFVAFAGTS